MINPEWDRIFRERGWGDQPDIELVRFVRKNFPKPTPQIKALELGVGMGANLRWLCSEGFTVFGCDGSRYAVSQINDELGAHFYGLPVQEMDCLEYLEEEIGREFVDLVVDVGTFMHQPKAEREKIFSEAVRVLKPGGRLFFSELLSDVSTAFVDYQIDHETVPDLVIISDVMFQPNIPYHFFTDKELLDLCRENQLHSVTLETTTRTYSHRHRFYDRFILTGTKGV